MQSFTSTQLQCSGEPCTFTPLHLCDSFSYLLRFFKVTTFCPGRATYLHMWTFNFYGIFWISHKNAFSQSRNMSTTQTFFFFFFFTECVAVKGHWHLEHTIILHNIMQTVCQVVKLAQLAIIVAVVTWIQTHHIWLLKTVWDHFNAHWLLHVLLNFL